MNPDTCPLTFWLIRAQRWLLGMIHRQDYQLKLVKWYNAWRYSQCTRSLCLPATLYYATYTSQHYVRCQTDLLRYSCHPSSSSHRMVKTRMKLH